MGNKPKLFNFLTRSQKYKRMKSVNRSFDVHESEVGHVPGPSRGSGIESTLSAQQTADKLKDHFVVWTIREKNVKFSFN